MSTPELKAGMLAMIVVPARVHEDEKRVMGPLVGNIVCLTRFEPSPIHPVLGHQLDPMWFFEPTLYVDIGGVPGAVTGAAPDCLKPLPGGEGEDEMLRIAGKPVEVTA
jgi:hypothetical protein